MSTSTIQTSRRTFLKGIGAIAAGAVAATAVGCAPGAPKAETNTTQTAEAAAAELPEGVPAWLGTAPEIDESKIVETVTTDLVIAGAGNGGLVAAAYAAANGVDFKLYEAATQIAETRSWFAAIDTRIGKEAGITVDRQRLSGEIARYSSGTADQQLIKMYMDESADMFEFVDSIMAPSGQVASIQKYEMPGGMGGTPYYTLPAEHLYNKADGGMGGPSRNELMAEFIAEKGNPVNFSHRLIKLVQDESGRVTGAIFQTGTDTYLQANANKAVLIATGGYVNNAQMLAALSPITATQCVMTTSEPNNDGQGQKAAMWAGAKRDLASATMIFDRGWVDPGTPAGFLNDADDPSAPVWPSNIQINIASQPWLKVNVHGERFTNESCDYDHMAHAASTQPNGTYFAIMDSNCGEDVNRFGMLGCAELSVIMMNGKKRDDGTFDLDEFFKLPIQGDGRILKADTLDELADLMLMQGKDKETFLATVERYNELYDKQEDEDFYKEPYRLSAIRKAPFYAASVGGRLLTSLDGIRINKDCQALGENWEPIEGLYCAGDCSGSVFSGCYPDQLHGFAVGRTMTEAIHVVKVVMGMK